jgi:hypothetical protein
MRDLKYVICISVFKQSLNQPILPILGGVFLTQKETYMPCVYIPIEKCTRFRLKSVPPIAG